MIRVVFLIVLILKTFALELLKGNTSCVTPYQETATCLPLLNCNIIASALATLTPQALQFAKDSQCGCEMGMVCCGSSNNQSYSPLLNCSVSPQQKIPHMPSASHTPSPNTLAKETTKDLLKGKSCVTPYGENATCIPVSKCDIILSALDTDEDRGQRLFKDSKCNCDMGHVCCGTSNNKSYTPLIDCAPPTQPEKIFVSDVSDESVCGLHSFTDRIKGGSAVKFDEFPWTAALEYQSKRTKENAGLRCGGSIVNKRYILTAAHCVVNVEFMVIQVWLGVTNTTSEKHCRNIKGNIRCINTVQKLNVENTIPHEFYNSVDKFNDVGLLRLDKDIEFSNYVRPICLPSLDSESPRIGTYLTVAGWGTTEKGKSSDIKLKVEVPLKDNNICNEYLKKLDKEITSKQLCVGGEARKDSCEGDSGGPLMYEFAGVNHDVQWYQQGIVSYGSGCGVQGKPGIYTKVSSYIRWISNKINEEQYDLGKDEPCTTVNSTIGTCVLLTTCEEVFKAAFTKNENGTLVAIESHCGDEHEGALVCCQNPESIIIPNFNSTALPDKTTCGILKNEPRINGTEIMDLAEFPWVAGIEFSPEHSNINEIRCIGTVINSRYVLTSADCLITSGFEPVNVWLGHWNSSAYNDCQKVNNAVNCTTNPVQKIGIKTIVTHPFFDKDDNGSYDIALVFLENEISISDYISPICLPLPNLPKLEPGTRMTVLRWTKYTTGFITTSDMMLKEEILSLSDDECNMRLAAEEVTALNALQLCAGGEGKQSCSRLIGAPLMRNYEEKPSGRIQWYLEGLVAFIYEECTFEGYPGSYTRVTKYLDWVINIISED